jgi:hypothetical protein
MKKEAKKKQIKIESKLKTDKNPLKNPEKVFKTQEKLATF